MTEIKHTSVLLNEVIEGLNLREGARIIDATFGGGGHSEEVCRRYSGAKIIALDQDGDTWSRAKHKFKDFDCEISFVNANFRDLEKVAEEKGIEGVDGVIFDLGLSSIQLENSGRGFSFLRDEPLLMTMKANPKEEDLTAEDIVNGWGEESLKDIIAGYGEERFAKSIAHGIVEAREKKEIKTTSDLVKIIEESVPAGYRRGRIHCATRTFQALRIAVNDELGALRLGLIQAWEILKGGGRVAVITFHSLEDRIVKNFFRDKANEKVGKLINKKPIIANIEELKTNNRARSAKLRIIEKII